MKEEHSVHSNKPAAKGYTVSINKTLLGVLLLVVVAVSGFVGGMQYQKHHGGTKTVTQTSFGAGGYGQQGGRSGRTMNGSFGTVTAISATSISVQDQRSNSTKTYSITNSTSITNNAGTVAYSDINVGDRVIVNASSSTSTTATTIRVNPTMGGEFGGQSGQSGGSATTN